MAAEGIAIRLQTDYRYYDIIIWYESEYDLWYDLIWVDDCDFDIW